ncbi:MAG: HWE histidine kinase domain-containing protein [Candidatus Andeanibacterium colombiense]|uniref:histidine kinase n=1 Tax=Candidatus Andeanibacterium colombiense TaxID=3121345 RepID=A0AAJ5X8Z0_9SPHN|nr:MAG: HWE histidine kinase domain-containing protein [Sphingomonadaceae bacterium]
MNMEDLYRLLRTSHVQAQGIVDTIGDPLLVLDEALCVQSASRSFFETFKVNRFETIGRPIYDLGDGQWNIPELRKLLLEVVPKTTAVVDYMVEHDFPGIGLRKMLLTARTLHHPDTGSHAMLLVINDATDQFRKEAAKDMLFGELHHRMKNVLGLAQSLARQTTTEGRSAEQFRDDFLGRFGALIDAQELAYSAQEKTTLSALLERILAPHRGNPDAVVLVPGASVDLTPGMVTSLSLIFHELATNAAKYGALSEAGGQVRICWEVEDAQSRLRISWAENGGPPVAAPKAEGYGTKLIQSAATYNLGGRVVQEFAADGLNTEIVIPLGAASPADHA